MVCDLDFQKYESSLEKAGYRCTWYGFNEGESELRNGLAYYQLQDRVIKIFYTWKQIGRTQFQADRIFRIEDVSHIYR